MNIQRRSWSTSATVCALMAALAVVGCGESDDATSSGTSSRGPDEAEIRSTLKQMGKRMGAGDGAGACRFMTEAARKQMAAGIRELAAMDKGVSDRGGAGGTCAAAFTAILTGNFIEDVDPEIVSVTIAGNRAAVVARVSHDKRSLQEARLTRAAGEWRVVEWFTHRGGAQDSPSTSDSPAG